MQTSRGKISNADKDIKAYGFVVGGEWDFDLKNSSYFWAEVMPSSGKWYRQLLPKVRRWWFEVNETETTPTDEMKIGQITHAYTEYGSGGAYTLRGCVNKAMKAIQIAADKKPAPPKQEVDKKGKH